MMLKYDTRDQLLTRQNGFSSLFEDRVAVDTTSTMQKIIENTMHSNIIPKRGLAVKSWAKESS